LEPRVLGPVVRDPRLPVPELGRYASFEDDTVAFFRVVFFAGVPRGVLGGRSPPVVVFASAGLASLAAAPRRKGSRRRRGFSSADLSALVASTAGTSSMSMSGAESPTRR